MTLVTDYTICMQCGFAKADYEFDCDTSEAAVDCRMCGHSDVVERIDTDGFVEWRHLVANGHGGMWYCHRDGGAWVARYLHSEEEVLSAERWLLGELAEGNLAPGAYLTRWDAEKRLAYFVIGSSEGADTSEVKRNAQL